MSDLELRWADDESTPLDGARPSTRGDCVDGERPCPFVGCRHHLQLDSISVAGDLRFTFRDLENMVETCSLDVADREREGMDRPAVGALLNINRERVRQIEEDGLAKLRKQKSLSAEMLEDFTSACAEVTHEETLSDIIDSDFKAAVDKAYERLVPAGERGAKAIRVAKRGVR